MSDQKEKEFIIRHIEYEKGMLAAWSHVKNLCNSCIKAHRKELTKNRIKELVIMNQHLLRR